MDTAHDREMPVASRAKAILRDRFQLQSFRPGQERVIEALDAEGRALAVFPTGGGKSLCYQLPALCYDGVTVVISPLIALMKDQIDYLRARGISAARLDSSLTLEETREVSRGLRDGSLKLLFVAPERFNNERFLEQLDRTKIALFAIDEAHCISEWGHNFRPDYLKLAETSRQLGVERVLALTATATPAVVDDIRASFNIPEEAAVTTGFHRPNLFLSTAPTPSADRDARLLSRLQERPPGATIVYVTLQATAERVAEILAAVGLPARAYHAGMDAELRSEVQEWWKSSSSAIVVATIAFGMGIDKADVRYVYHYNLPKGLESYSQEIGRAGRDGQPSVVELLGSLEDVVTLENFAYGDTPTREAIRALLDDVLGQGREFDLSLYSTANTHDIRPLVLRTALTYLELLGVLRQGTPFYSGYKLKPLVPVPAIIDRFSGERRSFIAGIFEQAKVGRIWHALDAQAAAEQLSTPRERLVAAVDYLAEQGLVELQVADARQRFTRLTDRPDIASLTEVLATRFVQREAQEMDRIARIVDLISHDGCQTAYLLSYFGEELETECGHCTWCSLREATEMPSPPVLPPIDPDHRAVNALRDEHAGALQHPRQLARFLCGLSSPATSRARLGRHPLFGALQNRRFREVLDWAEALATG